MVKKITVSNERRNAIWSKPYLLHNVWGICEVQFPPGNYQAKEETEKFCIRPANALQLYFIVYKLFVPKYHSI